MYTAGVSSIVRQLSGCLPMVPLEAMLAWVRTLRGVEEAMQRYTLERSAPPAECVAAGEHEPAEFAAGEHEPAEFAAGAHEPAECVAAGEHEPAESIAAGECESAESIAADTEHKMEVATVIATICNDVVPLIALCLKKVYSDRHVEVFTEFVRPTGSSRLTPDELKSVKREMHVLLDHVMDIFGKE